MFKAHGISANVACRAAGSLLAWGSAVGCSAPPNDYVPEDMPIVESRPGLVQNGGSADEWLSEHQACTRYRDALTQRSAELGCSLAWPRCPELVRPAASLACVVYSAPSVLMCERYFELANACTQVQPGSCLLTAVIDYHDPSCDRSNAPTPPSDGGQPVLPDAGAAPDSSAEEAGVDWMPDAGSSNASDGGGGDGGDAVDEGLKGGAQPTLDAGAAPGLDADMYSREGDAGFDAGVPNAL